MLPSRLRPLAVAFGGALCAVPGAGCGEGGAQVRASEPPPVAVEVTEVRPEELVDTIALTGQLEAEYSVVLEPEIEGVVAEILFAEGEPVEEGVVLVRLRDDEQSARVAEAQAELRLAQDVHERTQRLASRDAASLARRIAAEAELERARARVELARVQLRRTRVRAPFDGVVGQRHVSPGDRVDETTPLVQIDSVERLQLLFTVEEAGVALARTGVPIHARVAAWPGERFPGEVFFVSPSLDAASRRLLLKAWVPNPDGRLKPGMFANVDVEIGRRPDALLLPESAIVYDRNGSYVWRVGEEGAAEKVPVEIGLRQGGRVEITRGVEPGDRVVSAGTHKVMAGTRVEAQVAAPARGVRARDEAGLEAPGGET